METAEKTTEILNDLVEINNDRIEGYERAIDESKDEDADVKSLFQQMVEESRKYRQELSSQIQQLGGDVETGTTNSGKIYRAWMDIKATFTGHDRKAVLENCEFGEDAAQKAYRDALSEDGSLLPEARQLITTQQQALKASHDKIKLMRDQQRAIS